MKGIWKKAIAAAALTTAVLAAGAPAHAATFEYSLVDLGTVSRSLFNNYTLGSQPLNEAYGINDSGQVVGILKGAFSGTSQTHIIRWDNLGSGTTATDLYTGTGKTFDYGINNSGIIVGFHQVSSAYYAFQYNPISKTWTDLGKPTGSLQSTATAINDSGLVVGFTGEGSVGPNAYKSAFIYKGPGNIQRIPSASVGSSTGSSSATAINNSGLVTGYSTINNIAQAFIYDSSVGTAAGFQSLGTLGGLSNSTSYGTGINNSGAVVGYSTLANGVQHAFLYTGGTMIDLGALGGVSNASQANAINKNGVIVGTSNGHAFVYKDNQMVDLNTLIDPTSGFTLTSATGINNLGQIVGYGTLANGEERAFALTVTPTPIPPSVLLLGSGISGMFFLRRRKITI